MGLSGALRQDGRRRQGESPPFPAAGRTVGTRLALIWGEPLSASFPCCCRPCHAWETGASKDSSARRRSSARPSGGGSGNAEAPAPSRGHRPLAPACWEGRRLREHLVWTGAEEAAHLSAVPGPAVEEHFPGTRDTGLNREDHNWKMQLRFTR